MAPHSQNALSNDERVWERPLGVSFADDLYFDRIPDWKARQFYRKHHSYRPELDRVTVVNHAVSLDSRLVGAVTYAMPRRQSPLIGVGVDRMIEVARVCVGIDMPNLASCMLARSQDRFMSRWGERSGVELLISMVRADYEGSMFAALNGKGWKNLRQARSAVSGNREYTGIEDEDKELWVCSVENEGESKQTTLAETINGTGAGHRSSEQRGLLHAPASES